MLPLICYAAFDFLVLSNRCGIIFVESAFIFHIWRCISTRSRYINDYEIDLLKSSMGVSFWLPFAVSHDTGLRIGDVLKIKHTDIDGNILHYTAQKTGKSDTIVLDNGIAAILKKKNGSAYCFPSPRNSSKHLTRQAAWARIKTAARNSGVNALNCSPHSIRKHFAVDLYKRYGAEAVKAALQHSDIKTTEIYFLSDFLTDENSRLPLLRRDLGFVVDIISDAVISRLKERDILR